MSKKIRSDQEWLELIQECRASGLSVKNWCQTRSISIKTFYNKAADLRKKSCGIPGSQTAASGQKHEVVPLEMAADPVLYPQDPAGGAMQVPSARVVVTVRISGYRVEILEGASEDSIRNTLLALGSLC